MYHIISPSNNVIIPLDDFKAIISRFHCVHKFNTPIIIKHDPPVFEHAKPLHCALVLPYERDFDEIGCDPEEIARD